MKIQAVLLASAAVVTVQSYQIDPNLPDGTYFVPQVESSAKMRRDTPIYGKPIPLDGVAGSNSRREVAYGDPVPLDDSTSKAKRYVPLPISGSGCSNALENRWDSEGALNNMKKRCDGGEGVPAWSNGVSGILLSRSGSSLAYTCSWGKGDSCGSDEIDFAVNAIAENCGGEYKDELAGGEVCMGDWKKCYGHTTFTSVLCQNTI